MDGAYDSMHAMWSRLFWPAVALVMVSVAALLFRHALFVAVRLWSGHRTTEDSRFVRAIRVPSMLWCIVGGLAVALALQDTLSNLFAGLHLLADKPIRVGDYVRLSAESVEGYVVDVGWRSTRIRMLQNNVVVVPNKRVSESIITNYDLGETRMALLIRVRVGYDADADEVQRMLEDETTRAVGHVPGLLAEPPPSARLIPGFGDYALEFTLTCQ